MQIRKVPVIVRDVMSKLAPPMIWKEKLEKGVCARNPDRRLFFCRHLNEFGWLDLGDSEDEADGDGAADADTVADTEKPDDAPDDYVPTLLIVPEAG